MAKIEQNIVEVGQGTGLIVKALSGYYYVQRRGAAADEAAVQCRARGIFKQQGVSPLVGDWVEYTLTENGEGIVDSIESRSAELVRPPVANVDLVVLVFSVTEPALNFQLLDKFLAHIEHKDLPIVIVLSKEDLKNQSSAAAAVEDAKRIYEPLGYEIFSTSSLEQEGITALYDRLQGHVAVLAGQSGVGKSSLLNALVPGIDLETNAISNRLGRGKHTTRHVELIRVGSGYVADTPGFSQLDFGELGVEDLNYCFVEIRELSSGCKFRGCTHLNEPGCKVLEALQESRIAPSRYQHYTLFLTEMKEKKRRY